MITREQILATGLDIALRDDRAIAAALSIGRVKIVSTPIGIGTVLAVMAPVGGDFLNALEGIAAADANVKWTLKMVEQGTFDIGHPVTREQLLDFSQKVPALAEGIAKLLAVAEVDDPVPVDVVSEFLNREG